MNPSLSILALSALFAPLFAVACGDVFTATGPGGSGGTTTTAPAGGGGSGAAGGSGGSGGATAGSAGAGGCAASSLCGGKCVDLQKDPHNCGTCGHACDALCTGGACDDPVDIAAGGANTCAVLAKGGVYCWGKNNAGQLATGGNADSAVPLLVAGVPLSKRVFVGKNGDFEHLCAIAKNDDVYCWGTDDSGQLGIGKKQLGALPPQKVDLSPVSQMALGYKFTLAIKGESLFAWGDNLSQQLAYQGADSPSPSSSAQVSADSVAAGAYHGCRISGDDLSCWGRNTEGQVGAANNSSPLYPTSVKIDGGKAVEVACGDGFTCARQDSGAIKCWGVNTSGQLAQTGVSSTNQPTKTVDLAGGSASLVAAGAEHAAAIVNGDVWLWGRNSAGQVANNGSQMVPVPKKIDLPAKAEKLALGGAHTCALAGKEIYCWGSNSDGQIGAGMMGGDHVLPTKVKW